LDQRKLRTESTGIVELEEIILYRLECYLEGEKVKNKDSSDSILKTLRLARSLVVAGSYTAVDVYDHDGKWIKEYMAAT
jgi:hypothetical protein